LNEERKATCGEEEEALAEVEEGREPDIEELAAKAAKADEYLAALQRLQADFENYRKRTLAERQRVIDAAIAEVLQEFLPTLDHLEMALEAGEDGSLYQGVLMVCDQLKRTLESLGVRPIEAEGAEFDPRYHEAVSRVETEEHPENTVVRVLRKGYVYKERVLRPAMVEVAARPADEDRKEG